MIFYHIAPILSFLLIVLVICIIAKIIIMYTAKETVKLLKKENLIVVQNQDDIK